MSDAPTVSNKKSLSLNHTQVLYPAFSHQLAPLTYPLVSHGFIHTGL